MQIAAAARVAGKGGIHAAVIHQNVADVRDCLIANASCVNVEHGQWPPLIWSIEYGGDGDACYEIAELLLSYNADVNLKEFML